MSKTVDDLIGVYIEASNSVVWEAEKRGLCPMTLDMQRACIAAVVRAVRDEVDCWLASENMYEAAGMVDRRFNQILGDAGSEKVAGVPTEKDDSSTACVSPATAPAPAVCEWTHSDTKTTSSCLRDGVTNWMWNGRFQDKCPNCFQPIKFTEAK